MLQIKVGVHLPSLRLPLAKGIALAAKLGADAVEIDARTQLKPSELSQTARRQLRKLLDDYRLKVCAISFPTRRGYDDTNEIDARVAGTKEAMRMAEALGSSFVVNHVGRIPTAAESSDTGERDPLASLSSSAQIQPWQLLVQVLSDLGRHGQHTGALLLAETGVTGGSDLARLLAALPEGTLGIDFDPGQLVAHGFDPVETIEQLGSHIMHVHATDAGRNAGGGQAAEVPLGRGSVDFPAIFAALEERGYRGYFTIRRQAARDPEFEMGQAVQYLRNI
ncbi:MAG TPA: sugar phosphate isomerase/epimerase family protein [Pirellulales bacterium]|jgi:sugar phosphate isomerase/epimerase